MLCRYDRQKGKLMNQNNKFKGVFIYLAVIVLLVIGMVTMLQMSATPGEHTTYSKVISEFDNYNVSGYTLDLGSGELQYTLKSDNTKKYKYPVPNVACSCRIRRATERHTTKRIPTVSLSRTSTPFQTTRSC